MYPRYLQYITEKQVISTNLWRSGCTPALFSAPPQTAPWNVSVRVYPAGTEDPSALWGHNSSSSSSIKNLTSHTHTHWIKTMCDIPVCQTQQIITEIFRSDIEITQNVHTSLKQLRPLNCRIVLKLFSLVLCFSIRVFYCPVTGYLYWLQKFPSTTQLWLQNKRQQTQSKQTVV